MRTTNLDELRSFLKTFQRFEAERTLKAVQTDLDYFEEKYGKPSQKFYATFKNGETDDSEDTLVWTGLYEHKLEQERRLEELT